MKIYIAYGSNMNIRQMDDRYPAAKLVGTTYLRDYILVFECAEESAGFASVKKRNGSVVPVVLWKTTKSDEKLLDEQEGCPNFYRKECLQVEFNGQLLNGYVYIMNNGKPCLPSAKYYKAVEDGYKANNIDLTYLVEALKDTKSKIL